MHNDVFSFLGRKKEIIKMTEQLLTAITTGDFEAYTYVLIYQILTLRHIHVIVSPRWVEESTVDGRRSYYKKNQVSMNKDCCIKQRNMPYLADFMAR